jgi:heme A synthase
LCLVAAQFALGLFTVLTDRAADIATAHVAVGSLTLAVGCWSCWAVRVHQRRSTEENRVLTGSVLPEMPAVR